MNKHYEVLILNADNSPHDIWDWQEAISKLLGESGSVSPLYDANGMIKYEETIKDGKGNEYDVPAVLKLNYYVNAKNAPAGYSKVHIYARDLNLCQYCGVHTTDSNRTVDHVIPQSHWNAARYHFRLHSFENVVTACRSCNFKKRNRTPNQAGMKLLRQPKRITQSQAYYNRLSLRTFIPHQWKDFITNVQEK